MRSPHDVFFRRVFASPPRLAALLASALPPSVVRRLDLGRLERLPERKVTGRLRALEGDLVVRVPLRGRGPREAFVRTSVFCVRVVAAWSEYTHHLHVQTKH